MAPMAAGAGDYLACVPQAFPPWRDRTKKRSPSPISVQYRPNGEWIAPRLGKLTSFSVREDAAIARWYRYLGIGRKQRSTNTIVQSSNTDSRASIAEAAGTCFTG
jgi:hypothetical protein